MLRMTTVGPAEASLVAEILHRAHATNLALGYNLTAATVSVQEVARVLAEGCTHVAWVGGAAAGTLTLKPVDEDTHEVSWFAVLPEFQGQRVGCSLLGWAESNCRERGRTGIVLRTPADHPVLPAFYRAQGYEEVARLRWPGKHYDSLLMKKAVAVPALA